MSAKIARQILSILVFLCASLALAAGQQPLTASQLASEANSLSDLAKLGSYRLKAIVALGNEKRGATGTLTLDRDQENSRQELEFTDYREITVVRGNTGYFQRNPPMALYVAERLRRFDELWWVEIPPESEVGTVSAAKVHGVPALCFTVRPEKNVHVRNCFEAATHLLLSRESSNDGGMETLFLDYHEIEGVHVPGTIRFIEPQRATMQVQAIAAARMDFEATHFAPLPGARSFQTCRHMEPPRPLKRVDPEYPGIAKIKHLQGETHLLVTVSNEGGVLKTIPLSGNPVFLQSATDALRQWQYRPATCPSGPIEDDVVVVVKFYIR